MWRKSESMVKLPALDTTSSKKVVFVRKDYAQEERVDAEGKTYIVWSWQENKIKKEDWETYRTVMQNATDISDLTDAVMELAAIMTGKE